MSFNLRTLLLAAITILVCISGTMAGIHNTLHGLESRLKRSTETNVTSRTVVRSSLAGLPIGTESGQNALCLGMDISILEMTLKGSVDDSGIRDETKGRAGAVLDHLGDAPEGKRISEQLESDTATVSDVRRAIAEIKATLLRTFGGERLWALRLGILLPEIVFQVLYDQESVSDKNLEELRELVDESGAYVSNTEHEKLSELADSTDADEMTNEDYDVFENSVDQFIKLYFGTA